MKKNISQISVTEIARKVFRKTIETIDSVLVLEKGMEIYSDERETARNKVIIELAKLFNTEVKTIH